MHLPEVLVSYRREHVSADSVIVPLYVRPESNQVNYLSIIVRCMGDFGKVLFLARYPGNTINERILNNHYYLHYAFARNSREQMSRYPEFVDAFERKFKVKFSEAPVYGSFELLERNIISGMNAQLLFQQHVDEADFLEYLGQTIKKICGNFVVNYDMPAIDANYSDGSDILVIVILLDSTASIAKLNYALYESLKNSDKNLLLGDELIRDPRWFNRVRRTYHLSRNCIEAMFDLTDYALFGDLSPIGYFDTPLGIRLLSSGKYTRDYLTERLDALRLWPLVYTGDGGELINLRTVANTGSEAGSAELSPETCALIMDRILLGSLE